MKFDKYEWTAISIMVFLFILVGFIQGWSVSLVILNMCIISAIMTMGVNISWGYAGVINFGVMGFLAMGGLAAVLVSYPPVKEAWHVGGSGLGISFILLVALVTVVYFITKLVEKKSHKYWLNGLVIFFGLIIIRYFFLNATDRIEEVDPALAGFLGGANLPIIFSWVVGGLFAGGVAFVIGSEVKGGMYGQYPSIREADQLEGDLHFNNDFRSTYSTIIENWFGLDAVPIVNGTFEQFDFVSSS